MTIMELNKKSSMLPVVKLCAFGIWLCTAGSCSIVLMAVLMLLKVAGLSKI